jgi:DNA-binding GntR family transcriptional regulator
MDGYCLQSGATCPVYSRSNDEEVDSMGVPGAVGATSTVEPLRQLSLVELAVNALRERILAGQLIPGQRLVEERLTEELGISRPPLREAIRILQQEGLVTKLPRLGSQVALLTGQDYWELLTLRRGLEQLALRLGLPVTEPRLLDDCHQALAGMERCAEIDDSAGMVQAGYHFHRSVIRLAGNRRLEDAYHSLHAQLQLCMALNIRSQGEPLPANVLRHRVLLEPIERGDLAGAVAALEAHGESGFLGDLDGEQASEPNGRRIGRPTGPGHGEGRLRPIQRSRRRIAD